MIEYSPFEDVLAVAVEAYESAIETEPRAGIDYFLPNRGYPKRREVIAEMVRVEMEQSWRRREPIRFDDYLSRYPILADDVKLLDAVAFEDYRQRRLAGEPAMPAEYARVYGVDVSLWAPIRAIRTLSPNTSRQT